MYIQSKRSNNSFIYDLNKQFGDQRLGRDNKAMEGGGGNQNMDDYNYSSQAKPQKTSLKPFFKGN